MAIDASTSFVRVTTSNTSIISERQEEVLLSAPTSAIANYVANKGFRNNRSVTAIKNRLPDSVRWLGSNSYILERPPQKILLRDTKNNVEYSYMTPWMVYAAVRTSIGMGYNAMDSIFAFARPGPIQTLSDPLFYSAMPLLSQKSFLEHDMNDFKRINVLRSLDRRKFSEPLSYINSYYEFMSESFELGNMTDQYKFIHEDVAEFYTNAESGFDPEAYLRDYSELSIKDVCLLKRKIAFDSVSELTSLLSRYDEHVSSMNTTFNQQAPTSNVVDMFIHIMVETSQSFEFSLSGTQRENYGYQCISPEHCDHDNGHDDGCCVMCGTDISDYLEDYEEESPS